MNLKTRTTQSLLTTESWPTQDHVPPEHKMKQPQRIPPSETKKQKNNGEQRDKITTEKIPQQTQRTERRKTRQQPTLRQNKYT